MYHFVAKAFWEHFVMNLLLDSFDLSLKAVLLIKYINKTAFGWEIKKS